MIFETKTKIIKEIEDQDFIFQNTPIRVIANRNEPEIKLAGLTVGPFEEGTLYEIRFWLAEELVHSGIAYFPEGQLLNCKTLSEKHGRIKLKASNDFVRLPEFFYPQLKRLLIKLREDALKDPDKSQQYKKAKDMTIDLLRCRRNKILYWARSPMPTAILDNLTPEEKLFYSKVKTIYEEFGKVMLSSLNGEDLRSASQRVQVLGRQQVISLT